MKISTSILSAKDRVDAVTKLNRTNTSYIHVDVMDGKFVSNTQFNKINEVNAINMVSKYPMDIHLMVNKPYEYVIQYKNMNIEFITFHIESNGDKDKVIDEIKNMGYKIGISIKPNTDIKKLERYLDKIDMILVMSVEPGLGGQEFIPEMVDRIKKVKEIIGDRNILIEVDGGINNETIGLVQDADIAVVGSYITGSDNYYRKIEELLKIKVVEKIEENRKVDNTSTGSSLFKIIFWMIAIYVCSVLVKGIISAFLGYSSCFLFTCHYYHGFEAFFSVLLDYYLLYPFAFIYLIPVNVVVLLNVVLFSFFSKKMRDFKFKKFLISRYLISGFLIDIIALLTFYINYRWNV